MPATGVSAARRLTFDVAARAERLVAGSREDNHSDRRIVVRVAKCVDELLEGIGTQRIPHFRPVDRDSRDAVLLVVQQIGEVHSR